MTTPPHGTKRRGDDSVHGEERLSKRFNLLNLDRDGKLWVPPASAPAPTITTATSAPTGNPPNPLARCINQSDDTMHLDDTANKVYIHNLDEELASVTDTPDQGRLVFLPDIERKLAKIPKHILQGSEGPPSVVGNEMVLYSVPTSLSVPAERDSVRKAIIESRARAREESLAMVISRDAMLHDEEGDVGSEGGKSGTGEPAREEEDPDAMDIG